MDANRRALLHLFDRPTEPMFMPKGNNEVFDLPSEYLTDHYKPLQQDIQQRFNSSQGGRIAVKKISLPDISFPLELGRREAFSLFIPLHRKMASRLIEVLMGMRDVSDFLSASVYCRDKVNSYLFFYCYSVAILNRPDTRDIQIPSLCQFFPEKFVDGGLFKVARESAEVLITRTERENNPVEIPRDYTATDVEIEHKVAYWREDFGLNLHHWHWHLVYPMEGPRNLVDKDRRGELFYYMHQQIMARYNVERFCNNLGRTEMLNDLRAPLKEGYFPKLDSIVSSHVWPPRLANATLKDINRASDQLKFDIRDLERWKDRIESAIKDGRIKDQNGKQIQLTEENGIDILGNMIEASILSPNKTFYGDLHNFGHLAIGYCHDPDSRNLEPYAVMGDSTTAMRDPIFYRWHAFIDNLFQKYKSTLPRYTTEQLNFPDVRITGVEMNPRGIKNKFSTFWQKSDVDLSRGLDFSPGGPLFFRFTHLQHEPFSYRIHFENKGKNKTGTVRIFIAPKNDEMNRPINLNEQRSFFIELDKFIVNLKQGKNTVMRDSVQSSVTIPFERTFRNLEGSRESDGSSETELNNSCGCGWPQNLLIPKGTESGFECQLFVMVTNFQDDLPKGGLGDMSKECTDSASYCGIRDSLYPDRRSMGFPFDRPPRAGADTLERFLTPNMYVVNVTVQHTNKTELRPKGQPQPGGQPEEIDRIVGCS